jgi:hypothetical protein
MTSTQIGDVSPLKNQPGPSQPEEFHVVASTEACGCATLRIVGDLDLVTEPSFQLELDRVVAAGPPELVVDLTAAPFVSVRGYALIGQAGAAVDRVAVRTASAMATKVLAALGHDRVVCSRVPRPTPADAR